MTTATNPIFERLFADMASAGLLPPPSDTALEPITFHLTPTEREFCAWAIKKLRAERNGRQA